MSLIDRDHNAPASPTVNVVPTLPGKKRSVTFWKLSICSEQFTMENQVRACHTNDKHYLHPAMLIHPTEVQSMKWNSGVHMH